ncbi:hypothetical protein [Paenibacillus soyae]|uniref:Uncharacterized protein n=1 Tax=Paenibacillus soyae TaxID=2969249 RepID=A0A9X2S8K5_9BACL|nr:hypothetical protein [Paenibacillus soyae]MCR2804156.1 hypothetical protein [Paenibacillus soyae]
MRWIPEKDSSKWWVYSGISTVAVGAIIWLIRFGMLGQAFTGTHALRMLLLAAVVSVVYNLVGWLGARWLWGFSYAGLFAGLVSMAAYAGRATGWEDLASMLSFLVLMAGGIVVGIVAEITAALVHYRNRRG